MDDADDGTLMHNLHYISFYYFTHADGTDETSMNKYMYAQNESNVKEDEMADEWPLLSKGIC